MAATEEHAARSVEYQLTPNDLTEFQRYHLSQSPMIRGAWKRINIGIVVLLVLSAPFVAMRLRFGRSGDDVVFALVLLGVIIVSMVLFRLTYYRRAGRAMAKLLAEGRNDLLFRPHRITIEPLEIRIEHDAGHSATRWFAIEKVVTTPTAIYIYVSALSAHILPRRAFANDMAFDDFASAAAAFHRAAHPGRCLKCGYDLSKNTSGVCPECGAAIRSNVPAVA